MQAAWCLMGGCNDTNEGICVFCYSSGYAYYLLESISLNNFFYVFMLRVNQIIYTRISFLFSDAIMFYHVTKVTFEISVKII